MKHGQQSLWMTAGYALKQYLGMVDDSVAEASAEGWIALSGLSIPETNMAYVAPPAGSDADPRETLTRFTRMAKSRSVPLQLVIPQIVLGDMGDEIDDFGFMPMGAIPFMGLATSHAVSARCGPHWHAEASSSFGGSDGNDQWVFAPTGRSSCVHDTYRRHSLLTNPLVESILNVSVKD